MEATVPVRDRIPPPFNTIQVAAAVEQFLLASLKCSFDDFKGHRLVGPRWLALPWTISRLAQVTHIGYWMEGYSRQRTL